MSQYRSFGKYLHGVIALVLLSTALTACARSPQDKALDELSRVIDRLERSADVRDPDAVGRAIEEIDRLQQSIQGTAVELSPAQQDRALRLLARGVGLIQNLSTQYLEEFGDN